MSRFTRAMVAYGILGILAWETLTEKVQGVRLSVPVLAVLGLFAVRTLLLEWRAKEERDDAL